MELKPRVEMHKQIGGKFIQEIGGCYKATVTCVFTFTGYGEDENEAFTSAREKMRELSVNMEISNVHMEGYVDAFNKEDK